MSSSLSTINVATNLNPIEFDGIRKTVGLKIRQGLSAPERLLKLNVIAITQIHTLLMDTNVKRLK